MAGVGSTNAMKKGSGNNPFLALSAADMRSYLNSAYTGCIVKYTGPSTKVEVSTSDRNKDAQNLVFDIANPFTPPSRGIVRYAMKIDKMTVDGVKTTYICHKWINKSTGRLQNGLGSLDESEYWVYALIEIDDINLDNIKGNNVKFLAVTESLSEIPSLIDLHKDWPTTKGINGWQTNCINEAGKITLWSYSEDVKYSYADGGSVSLDEMIYYEPYIVNELYKVVYGDGQYYFEEFYYISEDVTTASLEDVAPGKTFYDFTGTKQTGTGTKINPYIAKTLDELKSYLTSAYKGAFVKYIGSTVSDTDGTKYYENSIYQVVDDGTTLTCAILPTLSNPGTAADLAQGKQLIDGDGKVVEGTAVPGDTPLTLTQEKMMLGQSTVYSTDAKYITYNVPSMYKSTLVGVDAPNCEFIYNEAFCSNRWVPSGSLSYSYSNPAYVPFTLNLPKCKYIGSSAFSNITKMSNIYLPEAEVIEDYAFAHFTGNWSFGDAPHTLYIPKCKKLGDYVFGNRSQLSGVLDCLELEEIGISPFSSTRGVTLNFDPTKIKRLSLNWWARVSTSAINFSNIYLPNCIEFAMGSGKNVRTADLPNCTILGAQAFYYMSCSSISLPKCETLNDNAFAGFNNSTTVISLPNVTSVSHYAFYYCKASSIYLPKVKYIEDFAFSYCSTINITIPTSDLRIKSSAFYTASILSTCSSYNGAYFISPEVVIYVESRQTYSEWSNSTVKVLPDYTFGWWGSSLNTVRLDAIESLPYGFGTQASIRTLIAPNLKTLNGDLRYLTSFDLPNVESISSICNYFGQYVSYINLPKLRGSIRCQHFGAGTSVLSYNLGKVTQLGYEAFRNARISLYDFPALRDYLPRGCLNNGNLLKVWLPCVTNIDWGACQSCTKLSTVLLRSFSSYAGGSIFSDCTSLSTFIVTAPEAFSFYSDFAYGTPIRNGGGSIYVRASLISTFKTLAIGNRAAFFSSRFTALENLPADVYNTLPMPFDIGSLNYAMTRGSTFEQFCQSPYNAEDYVVYNGYVYTSDKTMRVAKDGVPVKPTDIAVDYDYIKYELIE